MAEAPARVRLFQRAARQTGGEKSTLQTVASHCSFLPPREPAKPRLIRCRSKETQFKGQPTRPIKSVHQSPGGRRLRSGHRSQQLSDFMTIPQSLGASYVQSREDSPGASLTLEAINLELQLTAALEQVESMPSAIRQQRRLQAYMESLEATAARDPAFGPVLLQVKREAEKALRTAKVTTVDDLQTHNSRLTHTLADLKTIAKGEKDQRQGRDRVLENLAKENALLLKKKEELEGLLRRTALRGKRADTSMEFIMSELKEKSRKIKELDEEVRAARVREAKLSQLLHWMQDSHRSEAWGTEEGLHSLPARTQDRPFARHRLVPLLNLEEEEEEKVPKQLAESTSSSSALVGTPGLAHAETLKLGQ